MKKENHDPSLPAEKAHFKKKFILRKTQEEEAEEEIREFERNQEKEQHENR